MKKLPNKQNNILLVFITTLLYVLIVFTPGCQKDNTTTLQDNSSELESRGPIIYNEGLATILRGININSLSRKGGYYRIREFRVWNNPSQKCITLNILKNYGELAIGNSILPASNEKYVFSKFDSLIIQPTYRIYQVRDAFNNILKINMKLQDSIPAACWKTSASLTGSTLTKVTTQTYLSQEYNTCNFTEPSWTIVK